MFGGRGYWEVQHVGGRVWYFKVDRSRAAMLQ